MTFCVCTCLCSTNSNSHSGKLTRYLNEKEPQDIDAPMCDVSRTPLIFTCKSHLFLQKTVILTMFLFPFLNVSVLFRDGHMKKFPLLIIGKINDQLSINHYFNIKNAWQKIRNTTISPQLNLYSKKNLRSNNNPLR